MVTKYEMSTHSSSSRNGFLECLELNSTSHENPVFPGELPISVDGPATRRSLEHATACGTLVQCELHGLSPNPQF